MHDGGAGASPSAVRLDDAGVFPFARKLGKFLRRTAREHTRNENASLGHCPSRTALVDLEKMRTWRVDHSNARAAKGFYQLLHVRMGLCVIAERCACENAAHQKVALQRSLNAVLGDHVNQHHAAFRNRSRTVVACRRKAILGAFGAALVAFRKRGFQFAGQLEIGPFT